MGNFVEPPAAPAPSSATIRNLRRRALAGLAPLLFVTFVLLSCGDTYRPVANPVLKPGGDPQATHLALLIDNSPGSSGVASVLDISGDTSLGDQPVGAGAVHATFNSGAQRALVANKDADSLSLFFPLAGGVVATISLPSGSAPVFVDSVEATIAYVANSGTNTVSVINVNQAVQQAALPVGRTPVWLVESPDQTRLYSVNRGDGTVTALATISGAILATIPVGNSPVAAAIKSDGSTLYVLNQGSATVSVIDVASNTVSAILPTGPSPHSLAYDPHLRRLYVANTGSNTVSVFNADVGLTPLATVTAGAGPTSIAALADGTRFYVGNAGCSDAIALTDCSGNTVSVIDAVSFAVRKTITVGSAPVFIAADPSSTKVVVANRDSDSVSFIRTSDDVVVSTLSSGAPQPVFVAMGP